MKTELEYTGNTIFEQIKRNDENGNEYWTARTLAKVLNYTDFRNFLSVIEKAKDACINSGQVIAGHFEDMLDMITTGKTAQRKVESVKLKVSQFVIPSKSYFGGARPFAFSRMDSFAKDVIQKLLKNGEDII